MRGARGIACLLALAIPARAVLSGSPIERGALKRLELTRGVARRIYEDTIGCSWSRLDSSRQSSSNNSSISLACNRVTARRPPLPRNPHWPRRPRLTLNAATQAKLGLARPHLRFQLLLLSLHRCLPGATTPQKAKQHKTAAHKYADFSRVPVGCVCAQRPQVARTSACVECPPTRPRAERTCTPP